MSKATSLKSRNFTTNSRILNELLTKYRNTFYAFCQLVDNAIQANATKIEITIDYTKGALSKSPIKSINIKDNGYGVAQADFEKKIMEIGTVSKQFGQGVGRFAALQIGGKIDIETVAWDQDLQSFTKVNLPINVDLLKKQRLNEINFPTQETALSGNKNSYYSVTINNLYHGSQEKIAKKNQICQEFLEDNIRLALFEQYPYEIFNETVRFHVNDTLLERSEFIEDSPTVKEAAFTDIHGKNQQINFYFYKIKLAENKVSVFLQVDNNGIKSVAHKYNYTANLHTEDLGCWFIYVESPYFSNDLFRNLDVSEMGDDGMAKLKAFVREEITTFFLSTNKTFQNFTNKLKEAYPTIYEEKESTSGTQQMIFEKVAYLIEDKYKLLGKSDKLKDLIFPLIERSITDGSISDILDHILRADVKTTEKFRELLQMSGLAEVVHFSHSVGKKLEFLDFLHQICYGKIAKCILERSQLHKIVENQLWIFGEAYNGTPQLWSDKNLLNTLVEIRAKYMDYEPSTEDDNIIAHEDSSVNGITDLFFTSEKALDNGTREYMIVELKAPKCKISQKELNQIDRYAFDIEQHAAIPSHKVKFKLYLISSDYSAFAESKVRSAHAKTEVPFLFDTKPNKNIEVYVLTWADLMSMNNHKLSYMHEQLKIRDKAVSVTFNEQYAHLMSDRFKSSLVKVK